MTSSRQLAAIMFTDIVGYTALMGEDEVKAMELLQKNRQVQKPIIEKYNGKWIKEIGDGVLASFNTVSDAVFCAVNIQKACENEPDLNLRIGIHLGDIVFEGDDVFGDGVNIASRIEALAPAGGIWISDSVNRSIQNKQGIVTEFIREEQLKNVKEAVRIYEVKADGIEHSESILDESSKVVEAETPRKSNRKVVFISIAVLVALALVYFFYPFQGKHEAANGPRTIAVLAFDDVSPDGDQGWLGDGMADEILNLLAKVEGLQVTGKTSSFSFKGKGATIREIGETLGVKTVLEGSVSKVGTKYRFTAQLIDVGSDAHLWSDKYDRVESSEIFLLVDEIAQKIAGSLISELSVDQEETIQMAYKPGLEAYEYFIKAEHVHINEFLKSPSQTDFLKARELYQKSISIDPKYMDALAGLANLYDSRGNFLNTHEGDHQIRDSILTIAYQSDSESAYVLSLKGMLHDDIDSAFILLKKAYDIDPNNKGMWGLVSKVFILGLHDLSIILCTEYLKSDPLNSSVRDILMQSQWRMGQIEELKNQVVQSMTFEEDHIVSNMSLASIAIFIDKDSTEALRLTKKLIELTSSFQSVDKAYRAQLLALQGQSKAALKEEESVHYVQGNIDLKWFLDLQLYLMMDMRSEALATIDQIINDPNNSFIADLDLGYLSLKSNPIYQSIRNEPQFQEWLEEARVVHEERVRKYYHLFDD